MCTSGNLLQACAQFHKPRPVGDVRHSPWVDGRAVLAQRRLCPRTTPRLGWKRLGRIGIQAAQGRSPDRRRHCSWRAATQPLRARARGGVSMTENCTPRGQRPPTSPPASPPRRPAPAGREHSSPEWPAYLLGEATATELQDQRIMSPCPALPATKLEGWLNLSKIQSEALTALLFNSFRDLQSFNRTSNQLTRWSAPS